jgi:hypothetical protein
MSVYDPLGGKVLEVSRYPMRDPAARENWYSRGQSAMFAALRASVATILKYPHDLPWTVQGFGMMRTYFGVGGKEYRLNVWDAALMVPGVSTIHDHPWDFESWIINGRFGNIRYVEDAEGDEFQYMLIKCGVDGCAIGKPAPIRLRAGPRENYVTGDTYRQSAKEIHESMYDTGTVTLNARVGDTEEARVFWHDQNGKGYWVDAKPRKATTFEVLDVTRTALEMWK